MVTTELGVLLVSIYWAGSPPSLICFLDVSSSAASNSSLRVSEPFQFLEGSKSGSVHGNHQ